MDDIDVKILSALRENARATASEIGAAIGMSVSAVIERIKKLEANGVIAQYTAIISVTLEHPKYNDGFIDFVGRTYDVLEAHYLAGDADYLIKVVTDTTTTLEHLLREIKCIPGVARTCTSMVLSTVKNEHSVNPKSLR